MLKFEQHQYRKKMYKQRKINQQTLFSSDDIMTHMQASDKAGSPNPIDLKIPDNNKINISWRNSEISKSLNLSKEKGEI